MRSLAAALGMLGLVLARSAAAQDLPPLPESDLDTGALAERGSFGPAVAIEHIELVGNSSTRSEIILRVLPFAVGDQLSGGDPRLRTARFKVLALGFFRDVTMSMRRGSAPGRVVVSIAVQERGTVVLNRLWWGGSTVSPWWAGADLTERNLLGTGLSVGGGLVFASHDEVPGSRSQWAGETRLGIPALCGSRWGLSFGLGGARGSEAYRVAGDSSDTSAASHRAFPYDRQWARATVGYVPSALTRLSGGVRAERLHAVLPVAPTRILPDGRAAAIELYLTPGTSRVISTYLAYDRDSRPDPLLPHAGSRLTLAGELSGSFFGATYTFASLHARYERWWPLRLPGHALGVLASGGLVIGDAPRFERLQISDVNRMMAPRAAGLLLSANAPLAALGTAADKPTTGELGGTAGVEYVYRLFSRRKSRILAGDLFVGTGLWGLADAETLRLRDAGVWRSLPVDLYLDAGLRLDTDVGVFELTVANTLGRLPL